MSKLYLVDGSGYIFRAFYAVAPLTNSKGLNTNALFGFTRMIIKLLRDVNAEYIAVTFDTATPTFRHELYNAYKANRKECPSELVPQLPYFRRIVQALGIKSLEMPGFEADDIIATIATKMKNCGEEIIIVSGDKDLTQLVDDKITVWDAMRDISYNPAGVKEKFGVAPEQILDYLTLVGDSSDNVPGVKGIGAKSAQALIEHFGSLETAYQRIDEIENLKNIRGAKALKEKLKNSRDTVELSRQLISLNTEVAPFNTVKDLKEFHWEHINNNELSSLFLELEFESLLKTINGTFTHSNSKSNDFANKQYEIITKDSLDLFIEALSKEKEFAFDTETSSLDALTCKLVGISISWKKDSAHYLPLISNSDAERTLDAKTVRELLNPIFENPSIKKIGHNLKFDLGVLEEQGYKLRGLSFDSMLASYLLAPDSRQHGLKFLAKTYLGESMQAYEDIVRDKNDISEVSLDLVANYAAQDADCSFQLKTLLRKKLEQAANIFESSPLRVLNEIEMPLIEVLSKMERKGIKVDLEFLKNYGAEIEEDLKTLESKIFQIAGTTFNLNSPKQLSSILFEKLGLSTRGIKKTTNGYSTNAETLATLASQHEIAKELLEYRELFKLKSTYVDSLVRLIHPKTGRVHTSFNQTIAATGRLSSSDPNLQNIPIRTARGRKLRSAFVAPHGYKLISADYSQIELRVLAHLSRDENLKRAFIEGQDIHLATAKDIFGSTLAMGDEAKEYRRIAKTINFGIVYGIGAFRLARELEVSRADAQKYIDDYFARYPKVQLYFDETKKQISERGYVTTIFGRRRFLSDIDTTGRDLGYAERSLINAPIQGSAADIIKKAMSNVYNKIAGFGENAALLLQVHDELVCEARDSIVDKIKEIMVSEMETAVELSVPLKVDCRVNQSWG